MIPDDAKTSAHTDTTSQMRVLIPLLAAIAALGTAGTTLAQEWPRYYLGVALGQSDFEDSEWSALGVPTNWRPGGNWPGLSDTKWKLVAGFRPTRLFGVEIQRPDFVEAIYPRSFSVNSSLRSGALAKTDVDATVLSALLFIPESSARFDAMGRSE